MSRSGEQAAALNASVLSAIMTEIDSIQGSAGIRGAARGEAAIASAIASTRPESGRPAFARRSTVRLSSKRVISIANSTGSPSPPILKEPWLS
jgi:hypothetical protein